MENKNYKNDRVFLEKYLNLVELGEGDCRVLITPDLQGRVLTSTAGGEEGYSYGWLNYDLIASGKILPHCNNYGGEDRFWIGPEGGQFSVFFPRGTDFSFDDWQAPEVIDTAGWRTVRSDARSAEFTADTELINTSGNTLGVRFDRKVEYLDREALGGYFGIEPPAGVRCVGFRSENRLTNAGSQEWTRTSGMLSIWILGQFIPSDKNRIIIPLKKAEGCRINDAYFGKIGSDRLVERDNVLFFRGDGKKRGKIGIPPGRTVPLCGAYDEANGVLTLVGFSFDPACEAYVNSMWEHQEEPFRGDVINAYNDGPLEDGSIMGPFYEIESSSPAAALPPGGTIAHTHLTAHFTGDKELLNRIAKQTLGTDLDRMP